MSKEEVKETSVRYKQANSTRTHTRFPFNGPLSGTTRVSWYQKGKTNLDFTEARDSEWQWHQLGRMQVCISLQTDNHASTPPLRFFTGRMPFLPPNQQHQSTEGTKQTVYAAPKSNINSRAHYAPQPAWGMIHSASALRDWKRNRNLLKGYDDCFSVNIADACARRRETRTHHVRTAQNELDGAFVNLHVRQQKRICTTRPNNIHRVAR